MYGRREPTIPRAWRLTSDRPDAGVNSTQPARFDGATPRALTAAGASTLSLVSEKDRYVVGHILFSPVTIETAAGQVTAIGLAPMAVLPDQQRKALEHGWCKGLAELRRLGHDAVVVVGHPEYYPRFGFKRASQFGLRTEIDCPDEAFMAIELRPGALAERAGMVRYRPEFHTA